MKSFLNCYLFLILGFASTVEAQNQVYFEKFDVLSGLPESSVRTMAEDHLGYIWMGTQNGLVRYDGYEYKIYPLDTKEINGDPVSNIQDIFIGNDNSLWVNVNTNGIIFKYNRSKDTFTQFSFPENDLSLYSRMCTQDKSGNLWGIIVKSNENAYLWKLDAKGNFEFFGEQFKDNNHVNASHIYFAFTSQSGIVWIGTSNGFYRYQGKNEPFKGYATSNDSNQTYDIGMIYEAPSEQNIFWMMDRKKNNILRFDATNEVLKEFQPKPSSFNFPDIDSGFLLYTNFYYKNEIYEDKNKHLWFAGSQGLVQFNRKTETFDYYNSGFDQEKDPYKKYLQDIKETKEGDFWLTSEGGLVHFNSKTTLFERYLSDSDRAGAVLSNETLLTKMVDHTGALWLGFGWAGANKMNAKKSGFTIYKHDPKQENSYPIEVCTPASGKNGYVWFNNEKDIYKWTPNTNTFIKTFTVDAEETYDLNGHVTEDGNLYIATTKNLVFYNLKTGKKETYPTDVILKEGNLNTPTEDSNGIIWLETSEDQGIFSFDPKTKQFKHYPYRDRGEKSTPQNAGALDDNRVLTTYVDNNQNFWVGTNHGSLNLYDPIKDNFITYSDTNDKALRCITDIYEDASGRLWVGTYQSGLFEFDRKQGKWTRQLNEDSGLIFNTVQGIKEDISGQLWITTERGLTKVNPNDLSYKNYALPSILPENSLPRRTSSLFKLEDGKFMMQLGDGITVFDPSALDPNPFPPKVQLESIVVVNPKSETDELQTMLTYGKEDIQLTYEQNRVRFNYVGLHYDNPSANTYAYQLEGYDNDWVDAGTDRSVTYTNLSSGTYTFRVKAANSDGVWSTENPSITLVISPPWWQTWWAYVLYAIIFVAAISSFIAYRSAALKRENKVLEEKVAHRTNQLTKSIDNLKNTQNQLIQSEKMASLGELTAGIAHEIQNPLNFVNNFSEVSNELIDEIKEEREKKKEERDEELVGDILNDIKQNLEKINHHGKRADAIVKGMLQHSRNNSAEKEPTDINKLADEYMRLAYHGLRAKDKNFNATLETDYDESIGKISVIPQDIGRVILNLITNAFYAVNEKKTLRQAQGDTYEPTVSIITKKHKDNITISIKDNGNGIPKHVLDKIFQPFFTTKPTGEGTGLGLSMSYDIITQGHGGELKVETIENESQPTGQAGTTFTIVLPI